MLKPTSFIPIIYSSLFLIPHIHFTNKSCRLCFKIYLISLNPSFFSFLPSHHPGLNHHHVSSRLSSTLLTDSPTSYLDSFSFEKMFLSTLPTYIVFCNKAARMLFYNISEYIFMLRSKGSPSYLDQKIPKESRRLTLSGFLLLPYSNLSLLSLSLTLVRTENK